MRKNYEEMTMAELRNNLEVIVKDYNDTTSMEVRQELEATIKKIVDLYNEASRLDVWAKCLAEENAILAFVKTFSFDCISVKDSNHKTVVNGVTTTVKTKAVHDGQKQMDLVKFIDWAKERNIDVAAQKLWSSKVERARQSVITEWKKFFDASKQNNDTHSISVNKVKKAVQMMFDALVFIPTEKNENAVVATGKIARYIIGFANELKVTFNDDKTPNFNAGVLSKSNWNKMLMVSLHTAVEGKDFVITYGDEAPEVDEVDAQEEANK